MWSLFSLIFFKGALFLVDHNHTSLVKKDKTTTNRCRPSSQREREMHIGAELFDCAIKVSKYSKKTWPEYTLEYFDILCAP